MYKYFEEKIKHHRPQPLGQQKTYAVLLPLIRTNNGWQVLYQVRSQHISQPGEVAFPGGRLEEGESPKQAAIRETCEELNLQLDQIRVMGELDYLVHQHRVVHCFVGEIETSDWQDITPNEEVAELFTVPLEQLLATEPTYFTLKSQLDPDQDFPFERINQGRRYDFTDHKRQIPFYDGLPHNLWGMTAMLTHHFCQIIKQTDK